MDRSNDPILDFTLAPAAMQLVVDVQLRRCRERWIAVASTNGRSQTGIGESPRQALSAALDPLGRLAVTALMADPGLLEPSILIAQAAAG
jgi:hypothetical protein